MNVQRPSLLFLYAESPVHWGTGTSVGVVDLPIQRERHTDYPTGQSSGIKGALRDWFEAAEGAGGSARVTAAFGPETNAADHAGCVAFGDARLIAFPVRSLRGTFAYCTSHLLLARLARDLDLASVTPRLPVVADASVALVAPKSPLLSNEGITVEEYPVQAKQDASVAEAGKILGNLAAPDRFWASRLETHLCVLPEDLLRDLVRMATTVETHVRIDNETGTADDGGLFYEELLPSDSVLYTPMYVAPPLVPKSGKKDGWPTGDAEVREMLRKVNGQRVQMGAGATTGRGVVHCRLQEGTR